VADRTLPHNDTAKPLAMRMADIAPGTVIDDYVVSGKIGEGGMGTVYGASHPKLGKQVAIKVLRAELSANVDATTRFEQEALTLSKLGHPNIVDVSSLGTLPDGRAYFVMERLVGEDLGRTQQRAPLGLREICSVLNSVARALEAAHAKGIVHRDLKPENIFLHRVDAEAPVVKLLDFGIAKLSSTDVQQRTRTGSTLGTPRYVSPEQARGIGVDYRTDIYSLGVVTFELVARKAPFEGETGMDIMLGHLTQPPPRLSSCVQIPTMLDDIVDRMLAKDAAVRPSLADARAVFRAIEAGNDMPLPAGSTWPASGTPQHASERIRPPGVSAPPSAAAALSGIDDTVMPASADPVVSPGYAKTLAGPGVATNEPPVKAKTKSKGMWASIAATALAIAAGLMLFVKTQTGEQSASPTRHATTAGGADVARERTREQPDLTVAANPQTASPQGGAPGGNSPPPDVSPTTPPKPLDIAPRIIDNDQKAKTEPRVVSGDKNKGKKANPTVVQGGIGAAGSGAGGGGNEARLDVGKQVDSATNVADDGYVPHPVNTGGEDSTKTSTSVAPPAPPPPPPPPPPKDRAATFTLTVKVLGDLTGVTLVVDQKPVGTTAEFSLTLPAGKHTVRLLQNGRLVSIYPVDLSKDQTLVVRPLPQKKRK